MRTGQENCCLMKAKKRNPRKGDIVIYRWGIDGIKMLAVVLAVKGTKVKTGMRLSGFGAIESVGLVDQGQAQDGKKAAGTWRWPRDGELVKRRGKWEFAEVPR